MTKMGLAIKVSSIWLWRQIHLVPWELKALQQAGRIDTCISLTDLLNSRQRPNGRRTTGAWLHGISACSSMSSWQN